MERTEIKNILDSIEFTFNKQLNNTNNELNKTTFNILFYKNGKELISKFTCNPTYIMPEKELCLSMLINDMNAFDEARDAADFLNIFGYINNEDTIREGLNAYKQCEKTKEKLEYFFDDLNISEINEINDYINDYARKDYE